jgi:DNA-directed RNA polymerase specialized sigma subunit
MAADFIGSELPEKNLQVNEEYYFKDCTLEEIASQLGFPKSWVCRLHSRSDSGGSRYE